MRYATRCAFVVMLILVVISGFSLGCGKETTKVEGTVKIGFVTDLTGPLQSMTKNLVNPMEDAVKYVNEEASVLEGLKFEIVYGDQASNDSLNVTVYNQLKEQGCQIILCTTAPWADTVKGFAENDEIVILSLAASEYQIDPPGWVFVVTSPVYGQVQTMLKWVHDEDWDYDAEGRIPKVGIVVWDESYETEMVRAVEDYTDENPEEFDLGAAIVTPLLTSTFTSQIEQVKNCDYIFIPQIGMAPAQFVKEFRDKGYTAKFLGTDALTGYKSLMVGMAGWSYIDGTLTGGTSPYWTDDNPIIDEAWASLQANHSDAQSLRDISYCSTYPTAKAVMELLAKVVKDKGSADITGQDIYDAAVKFSSDLEGETRQFSNTDRIWRDSLAIYEWRAADQDLYRISDWLPIQ